MDLKQQEVKIKQLQKQIKAQQAKIETRVGKAVIKQLKLDYSELDTATKVKNFVKTLSLNDNAPDHSTHKPDND